MDGLKAGSRVVWHEINCRLRTLNIRGLDGRRIRSNDARPSHQRNRLHNTGGAVNTKERGQGDGMADRASMFNRGQDMG